eukprot:NP_001024104.1 Uncharacterized protein CELE_T05B11.7 [Caenorhabditis elegans]
MSFGDGNPTFEELMEVVQRQQEVIELFEQQIEACRIECVKLADESERKSELFIEMEKTEEIMKNEIEFLKTGNDSKRNEREEKITDSELETVGELRIKCKEITFNLEKLKTQNAAQEVELELQRKNNELLRLELDSERQQNYDGKRKATVTTESIQKDMLEKCAKLQESQTKYQIDLARMKSELELKEHREKQLERHYEDIMDEMKEIRKEKSSAMVKCSAMTSEIAELKTKIQQLRGKLPRNEHDIEDMNKLLGDQSHLIAALREETKLLARKLEGDSRDYR